MHPVIYRTDATFVAEVNRELAEAEQPEDPALCPWLQHHDKRCDPATGAVRRGYETIRGCRCCSPGPQRQAFPAMLMTSTAHWLRAARSRKWPPCFGNSPQPTSMSLLIRWGHS